MVKEIITISNPTGLHTRPAKQVVAEAKKFESDIIIKMGEKEANVKSLLKLMKLGICQSHSIEIVCEGPDESEALNHLKNFILNLEA
ncbi:MAG: HPr family phosphocarrier protein [Spirochaetaceae bacterium]|jgi:phosphocarrier protein HPr|nr:HPr family phosphocarrier protein [Spirochaetaceae bacterium]